MVPQARCIRNVYAMRKLPTAIRKGSFNETTVEVLVAEAYKDKKHALAYLGAAERILEKIPDKFFVSEYNKKIKSCRMQLCTQPDMHAEPFAPPRVSASIKPMEKAVQQEVVEPKPKDVPRLVPVPA
mgnify:CR=1 FL=1